MNGAGRSLVRLPFALVAVLLAAVSLAGCGSQEEPKPLDRDEDGVPDAREAAGWDIQVDLLGKRVARHVASDPGRADSDGDGLLDVYEYVFSLDPRANDTDLDGLTDCQEKRHTVRSECEDPEFPGPTDGGAKTEADKADSDVGYSRYVNAHPFEDTTGTLQRPILLGDGIPDGVERAGYDVRLHDGTVRHVRTDARVKDTDKDGLEDGEEAYQFGTDPTVADTDYDGCPDGRDIFPETQALVHLGFLNLTWLGNATGHLQFQAALGGPAKAWPQEPITVQPGGQLDLASRPGLAFEIPCSFFPYQPWIGLELRLEDVQEGQRRPVPLAAASLAEGGAVSYMNPRTGETAVDGEGANHAPGPLALAGAQVRVTLAAEGRDLLGRTLKDDNQNP